MIFCKKKPKFTWKNYLTLFFLFAFSLLLIRFLVPSGSYFGSRIDWYSQHLTIADYMRKQFFATGNLFPDFTGLGGGTNFFSLSYYGFMRPDILVSYLFPGIGTAYFIQGYAILGILMGGALLYYWIFQKGFSNFTCTASAFLYMTAGCLYHAHKQIMFVNYLPFLILAFICIDHILDPEKAGNYHFRPHIGLVLSLFFCILHSFYFFPSCFVACILYLWHLMPEHIKNVPADGQKKRKCALWWNYIIDVSFASAMSIFLLLPTGLAMLGNKKDTGGFGDIFQMFSVNTGMEGLLYGNYNCGLTLICLYAIFLCIKEKETRKLSISVFVLLFFNIFEWILNITLYVRPKCLIPFVPLIIYLVAQALERIRQGKMKLSLPLALLACLPVILRLQNGSHRQNKMQPLFYADMLLLLVCVVVFIVLEKKKITIPVHSLAVQIVGLILICTIPTLSYIHLGQQETYIAREDSSRDSFSQEELEEYATDSQYRFDFIEHLATNANYVVDGNQNKSSLYSSISNTNYNVLLYDILHMPIGIHNRVSMTSGEDPFQEYLMGVRYIRTIPRELPAGYTILKQNGSHILAENQNVLPLAYGSTALMAENDFNQLSYPRNLDTLTNRTIVPSSAGENSSSDFYEAYSSQMKEYALPENFLTRPSKRKKATIQQELPEEIPASTILLLSFDVNNRGKRDVTITINGIQNRLSGPNAPYPNNNKTFTYMISSDESIDTLKVKFSRGKYSISNIKAYTIPLSAISNPGVVDFQNEETSGKEILNGSIDMPEDGYFVTSYTFSSGYQAYVDGERVTPVQVNKAFVGFPLKKGAHSIQLEFHAPGKTLSFLVSGLAAALLVLINLVFVFKKRRCEVKAL